MKKNVMMRVASVLLICVLLTSSVISGTFAKYVTTGTGTDTARVAKWGVNVTAAGTTFAETYDTHDPSHVAVSAQSVISSGGDVIAPGTSKEMAHVVLTGTPEVSVKVTYSADFALSDNWIVDGDFYCPLKVVVCGTVVDGATFNNKADFEAAVEALINGWSKQYAPGTDLTDAALDVDDLVVYWEWPFSTSEANDVKDTKLGDKAVAEDITVTLKVTCTVTQID